MLDWLGGITPGTRPAITAATWRVVREVNQLAPEMEALPDVDLRRLGRSLSYRAKAGEPVDSLIVESFAATREAGRRRLGMRHYDVQLLAGAALVKGAILEMQTGEGKTLVATLPLVLYALAGKGAHLATVNDYLARRDAEWMEPIYEALGLKVGIVESQMDFDTRRQAYARDVTYGTAKEFGFDFLKDRLMNRELAEGRGDLGAMLTGRSAGGAAKLLQRPYWFALVDEADNVLIDEARTRLRPRPSSSQVCLRTSCSKSSSGSSSAAARAANRNRACSVTWASPGGEAMISGVRASSIRTLSASSTRANQ